MIHREHLLVGEDVIVMKQNCHVHNKLGQVWKVRTNGDQLRVSVSFDGEIYNFNLEDIVLA